MLCFVWSLVSVITSCAAAGWKAAANLNGAELRFILREGEKVINELKVLTHVCAHVINDVHDVLLCSSHQAERRPASWQPSDSADGSMKQLGSAAHTSSTSTSGHDCLCFERQSQWWERRRQNQTITSLNEQTGFVSALVRCRVCSLVPEMQSLCSPESTWPATRSWEAGEIKNVGRWQLMGRIGFHPWVASCRNIITLPPFWEHVGS